MIARAPHRRRWALLPCALLAGCATHQPAPVEVRSPGGPAPGVVEPLPAPAAPGTAQTFPAPDGVPRLADTVGRDVGTPATVPRAPQQDAQPAANPAVVALLNRANQETGSGRHDTAAASLERAIKIEPGNAWLWHRLASTRLAQGRPGEAAALAAKSNTLAVGDAELQAENWLLIAQVHRARGEDVAARAAEQRARELAAKPS